jgi:hypothetical protein
MMMNKEMLAAAFLASAIFVIALSGAMRMLHAWATSTRASSQFETATPQVKRTMPHAFEMR